MSPALRARQALHLVVAAASIAVAAPAQGQATAIQPGADKLPMDTTIVSGRFANGLRYYVRPNREPRARAELRLVVDAGSVLEDESQRGLAHVLEHMMFRGTQHFERQQLVDYLQSVGLRFGPDLNAYTTFDRTVYMLTVPTDSARVFANAFQILEDWAHLATLDSTAMERERPVVIEEWRLGRGAGTRVNDKEFPVLLSGSRYADRLPIGRKEVLDNFKPEDVRRFYRTWYRPDLMTVVAVGDFDAAHVVETIRSHFARIENPRNEVPRPSFAVPINDTTLGVVVTDPELTSSSGGVSFKRPTERTRTVADFRTQLVRGLSDAMLDERLGEIARRAGAPYVAAFVGSSGAIGNIELYSAMALVPEGGITRGLGAVLGEIERVRRFGFTATEVDRARRTLLRTYEQSAAESEKTSSEVWSSRLVESSQDTTPVVSPAVQLAIVQRLLPTIAADEVNRAATDRLTPTGRVFTAQAPQKSVTTLPTVADLKQVAAAAVNTQLTAYVDSVGDVSLVPHTPDPGKVVATRVMPTIGVTEWTLSNGVRVLVKPTSFKADQVIMSAYQPGGMSLASDAEFRAVSAASFVPSSTGAGTFNAATLEKSLAGKTVRVSPTISGYGQGFGGAGSPRDLETMLQLVYLYATAPRPDSVAFNAFKARIRPLLENRSQMPETSFSDSLQAVMSSHSAREAPLTAARLDSTNFARSYDFYRSRFANVTGMTFVFVGNVSVDSLRPLVERWLGSLPANGHAPAWHDVGVRPMPGIVQRDVYAGSEPKARTTIVFHGSGGASQRDRFELAVLSDYLQLKLNDLLRIEQGGTYGVGVGAESGTIPVPEYAVRIGFGASPDRVDSLTRTVFAVVDSLKAIVPTDAYVEKVKTEWLRSHETDVRDNSYWIGALSSYVRRNEDPATLPNVERWMSALGGATLRDAARKYLSQTEYVRVTLHPAASEPARGVGRSSGER